MKFTFNGCQFIGNGVPNINYGITKNYSKKKSANANGIDRITVECDCADIQMNVINTNNVEAHFFGQASTDGNLTFDVVRVCKEIKVTAKLNGCTISSNLNLHISIPSRMFEVISARSENGDVTICENVIAKSLESRSSGGNVESYAFFKEIKATTMNGNVKVCVNAKSDVDMEVSSMNGNVDVELRNIAYCNLFTSSISGSIRNCFHSTNGFTANGKVVTLYGNVRVK